MARIISVINQKGGVGKCVHPKTPVFMNPGEVSSIEDIFNRAATQADVALLEEDGVFVKPREPLRVWALDNDLRITSVPVQYVYRGKAHTLVQIITAMGKKIAVTPVHPLLVIRSGELRWVKAQELQSGDFVATPRVVGGSGGIVSDLLSLYSDQFFVTFKSVSRGFIRKVYQQLLACTPTNDCRILNAFSGQSLTRQDLSQRCSIHDGVTFRILKKFVQKGIVGVERPSKGAFRYHIQNPERIIAWLYQEGCSIRALQDGLLPRDVVLRMFYQNASAHKAPPIKPLFSLTPSLARFVALVLAEGSLDPARVIFYNSSPTLIHEFKACIRSLGLQYDQEDLGSQQKITVPGAGTLAAVFRDLFELDPHGNRKSSRVKVPNCILASDKSILAAYLGAYIDAEGYVSQSRSMLEITSASEENVVRLHYAFLRFDIITHLRSKIGKATNSPVPKERTYYTLRISGADQLTLVKHLMPLHHVDKKILLIHALARDVNTNIDVIPVQELLKKSRRELGLLQREGGAQGSMSDYERGRSLPSPRALKDIIARFKKVKSIPSLSLRKLEVLSRSHIFWDKIKSVVQSSYNGYVYDLTVPEGHNFIAGHGAFIAHNTTTAVNVGAYLAHLGKTVLVVDLDPQANATSAFGIDHRRLENGLYSSLVGLEPLDAHICQTDMERLHLIPATGDLAGANIDLVHIDARESALARILEPLTVQYDYILIDNPPSLGLLTVNGLVAAKEALVPVQCEYYALEGLGRLLETVALIQKNLRPDLAILGAVMTMYDERNRLARSVFEELYRYFPNKIFRTVIPRSTKLAEAPSFGKPILLYDRWSRGARAYKRLAREILETEN